MLNNLLKGNAGKNTINGAGGKDTIKSGTGNDTLIGGGGVDKLIAGGGNDVLIGGNGNDILKGGAGADIFKFLSLKGTDKIKDFSPADDVMQLKQKVFDEIGSKGELNDNQFTIGTEAKDSNDYLIYNKTTGALFYDADGSGSGAPVKMATIGIGLNLTADDFMLV